MGAKRNAGAIPEAMQARLERALPTILEGFGTPCFVYDEQGIFERGRELLHAMRHVRGFRQYYAVKALPNPENLRLQKHLGFGFDCSSPYELHLMEKIGVRGENIMFTSNNSRPEWFEEANRLGGIVNLDDISFIDMVKDFPEMICFRLNPGRRKTGNSIIGEPVKAKYGITWKQMIPAYKKASERGAKIFGLHTMVCSNCRDEEYLIDTARMGFKAIAEVEKALGIQFEFFNMGGGFGIPYGPTDKTLNINRIGERLAEVQEQFRTQHGYAPRLFTEMGRWMTGPFGVLLVKAINRMKKYETYIGVDAGMEALPRPAFYRAYHHIEVCDAGHNRKRERVNIVDSMCENWGRLTPVSIPGDDGRRFLPEIKIGDVLMVANCGAHAHALGGLHYNGKTSVQEIMLWSDGTTELIRRAETFDDLDATLM